MQVRYLTKHVFLIISAILLFNGCMDFEGKLTINADGSGKLEQRFVIDKMLYAIILEQSGANDTCLISKENIESYYNSTSGFRLDYAKEEWKYGQRIVEICLSFDDIFSFEKEWSGADTTTIDNKISINQMDEYYVINWRFGHEDTLKTKDEDNLNSNELVMAMVEGRNIDLQIMVPSEIIESRPEGLKLDDPKAIHWKFPLSEFMTNNYVEATIKVKKWQRPE